MSRSRNEISIPHRYRKGRDGGKRKSYYWMIRKYTKPEYYGESNVRIFQEDEKVD
jgi:hypothetical protein